MNNHSTAMDLGALSEGRLGHVVHDPRQQLDPVERTREAIQTMLPLQIASLTRVANRLQMSEGTLKRVLKQRGMSYRELRDRFRFELAVTYLEGSEVHMAEISMLVGFSEETSFFRAFKRWAGETPGTYRRRAQGAKSTSA